MSDASICGLGQTAYAAIESAIKRLRLYDDSGPATMSAPITLDPHRPAGPRAEAPTVALTIDGRAVSVPEGTTILSACASHRADDSRRSAFSRR